ncbi:MAG: SDR family NAD(P)-dependent oxidoreductase [Calditrichia bacterium]
MHQSGDGALRGRIDILVNNAAGNFIYPAEKLPLRGWKSVIDIVLNGSFFCSQIIGQEMIKRNSGQIPQHSGNMRLRPADRERFTAPAPKQVYWQ